MNPKQLAAVFALPPGKRIEHFVKVVADRQKAWGLYQDGWAMAAAADGQRAFPLWPQQEYAAACAQEEWAGYEARSISLEDLMEVVLPQLKAENTLPAVFPTPDSNGATPSIDELVAALDEELKQY